MFRLGCFFVLLAAGASAAQPGLRINLSRGGGNLLRQFPDALTPYMHFGCSMEVSQECESGDDNASGAFESDWTGLVRCHDCRTCSGRR
jgi:hypothetical protein